MEHSSDSCKGQSSVITCITVEPPTYRIMKKEFSSKGLAQSADQDKAFLEGVGLSPTVFIITFIDDVIAIVLIGK